MKTFVFILLFITSSLCSADNKCALSTEDITLVTPTFQDVSNTFWQDDKEERETIKRLYINYKDGSVAVIEHRFCSMYNFKVAYYEKDRSKLSTPDAIHNKIKALFAYSANQDSPLQEAIETMTKELSTKNFTPNKDIITSYDDTNEKHQRAEYSLRYFPIEHPSLHKAALIIYMGIGGMH